MTKLRHDNLRIAYITTGKFPDASAWSGTNQHIHDALLSAGAHLTPIHSLHKHRSLLQTVKKTFYQAKKQRYQATRDPRVLEQYASQVSEKLKTTPHDVILSPGSIPIAHLHANAPIVCYTDATFAGVVDYYEHYSRLSKETLDHGHDMERRMLDNVALAVYSSDWAAATAREHYQADASKVKVVPFGANLTNPPSSADIHASISSRSPDRFDLLFIGVDWKRKGGEFAVAVVEAMNNRTVRTHLHVVGCQPTGTLPECVTVHGYLDKSNPDQYKKLQSLFMSSHLFILPSQAECFGVVFAEACAYGLPSIAVKTGGVDTAIQSEITGWTQPPDASVDDWCDAILPVLTRQNEYQSMARRSRDDYENRLNWKTSGKDLMALIRTLI